MRNWGWATLAKGVGREVQRKEPGGEPGGEPGDYKFFLPTAAAQSCFFPVDGSTTGSAL